MSHTKHTYFPRTRVPKKSTPPAGRDGAGEAREPLNRIRRLTGEYMVTSKSTSPHVLTAIEVDYENIERVRTRLLAAFA